MNWSEILTAIMEVVISIGIPFLFSLISSKVKNETALKLICQAEVLASDCVRMIEQTYVIPMKNKEDWNATTAKIAFEQCRENLLKLLNDNTIKAIKLVHGDLEVWLQTQIEAAVLNVHNCEN